MIDIKHARDKAREKLKQQQPYSRAYFEAKERYTKLCADYFDQQHQNQQQRAATQ